MLCIGVLGFIAWGPIISHVEQPSYNIVETSGNIEIRDYAPTIVAETHISGLREVAINQGFRLIADYIFGNNAPAHKVAMTAPVTQQQSDNVWTVRFTMPSGYTLSSLPVPNSKEVTLKEIGRKRMAVIRFSGMWNTAHLKKYEEELTGFIHQKGLKPASSATYAFYNPPWTLPFLRRNEVMIEITQ